MKTIYFDCSMGAAGDMLTGALLDLMDNKDQVVSQLNTLGIPGVNFLYKKDVKCGITGTHMSVEVNGREEHEFMHQHEHQHEHHHDHEHQHEHDHDHHHDHEHQHLHDHDHHHEHKHGLGIKEIVELVGSFPVSDKIKKDIKSVFGLIADAESQVHGKELEHIHFHEVGSLDAIADVSAVCILMDMLGADKVICSPIHVGAGTVKCAHGILPVPAPATALILKECPIYGGSIMSELCTPTGAALLKYFADDFGSLPAMSVDAIGYGMGTKEFERANCVRVMMGQSRESYADMADETVTEIRCNIDDMTAEEIGFAMDRLYEAGAREVYSVAANMKKNRPGCVLYVICDNSIKEDIIRCLFKHTSTIGIREYLTKRYVLDREMVEHDTPYGRVREKISKGYDTAKSKLEYDDIAAIAKERGLSIQQARNLIITSLSE